MIELQAIVAESRGAQLAFGAMGECFSLLWYGGLVFVPWLRFIIFFIYFCRLPCNVGSLKGRTWWPWNGGKSFFPIYLYTLFFLYFQFYHSKKYILREKKSENWTVAFNYPHFSDISSPLGSLKTILTWSSLSAVLYPKIFYGLRVKFNSLVKSMVWSIFLFCRFFCLYLG